MDVILIMTMKNFNLLIKLEFLLLECKCVYYKFPQYKGISDHDYDNLESKYIKLCNSLNKTPWVQQQVGFDSKSIYGKYTIFNVCQNEGINFNLIEEVKNEGKDI